MEELQQPPHVADGAGGAGGAVGLVDEGLDGRHAGIAAVGQCAQDRREGKGALARAAAVGVVEVDVGDEARGKPPPQQLGDRLLLGAGGSGAVDHGPQRGVGDGAHDCPSLLHGVDVVRLGGSQRLDAIDDTGFLSH